MHLNTGTQRARVPAVRAVSALPLAALLACCACFIRFPAFARHDALGSSVLIPAAEPVRSPQNDETQRIIRAGPKVGAYVAFPDICRARNGELLCVFYSGYAHVSPPNEKWPNGGRVMLCRSTNSGETWSAPVLLADTPHDDRDPSIASLSDGTLLCNWFAPYAPGKKPAGETRSVGIFTSRSRDIGRTWSPPAAVTLPDPRWCACSSPVRELPDHTVILGLYTEEPGIVFGATARSRDGGKTWGELATIGEGAGLYLDAETDVIRLKDGSLLAALRSSTVDLHFARSADEGGMRLYALAEMTDERPLRRFVFACWDDDSGSVLELLAREFRILAPGPSAP